MSGEDEHRGLRGLFSGFFSTPPSQNHRSSEQVTKLMEELGRQRDLKETYKARLESTQGYLRFCLEVAQEHGFLHLISDGAPQQQPPHGDTEAEPATTVDAEEAGDPAEAPPCDPYLAATRDLAVQHGWSVAPDEVELHEVIGRGTTADIHRATWRGLDVAVKWVRPELFRSNPSGEAFFAQEADVLSRQRHPHVLRLLGACLRPPDRCFLVTELLSGATLGEWLHGGRERRPRPRAASSPPPPLVDRVSRALEVALAVRHLHAQMPRVVHRDLKPSNVLLDAHLRARVTDFGHARFLPDGKEALTGETGTYVYMAPEVIRCEPYTDKCDVYSFGIMLNELITAEHPYIETSYGPSKIALNVANGTLRPKLPERDAYPAGLTDLICWTWDAEPSSRPSFATITLALGEIKQQIVQHRI